MSLVIADGLTREQIAFIRKADERVSFHVNNGRTFMVFGNRAGITLELDVEGGISSGYHDHGRTEFVDAFTSVTAPSLAGIWQTFAQGLKPGDSIILWFRPDHFSNGVTKEAGVHADALFAQVRPAGDRAKKREVLMDVTVAYDNSARMVR